MKPDFDFIKAFYRANQAAILAAGANAWGIDPYAWSMDAGIHMSKIEDMFWYDIREVGVVLYPQYPVGRFFVDFANPAARVAIECDGKAFHQDKAADALRQREIEALGWSVYRLTGRECLEVEIESEDEIGRAVREAPAGVKLLREIDARHNIRIGGRR